MSHLLLPLGLLVVLAVLAAVVKVLAKKGKAPAEYPYQKEPTLFTPAERSFLGVLEQAVGNQFRIMGKVRLADVIRDRPGMDGPARQKAFNRIQSKHLDFVACDPGDFSIQFAVELDDKSHERGDRQERDAFLDAAMKKAGLPVIRFAAKASYSVQEVRDTIAARVNEPPAALPAPLPIRRPTAPVAAAAPAAPPPVRRPAAPVPPWAPEAKQCPACGGDMVLRKASKGANAGSEFWGCSNYPKCKKILPV